MTYAYTLKATSMRAKPEIYFDEKAIYISKWMVSVLIYHKRMCTIARYFSDSANGIRNGMMLSPASYS